MEFGKKNPKGLDQMMYRTCCHPVMTLPAGVMHRRCLKISKRTWLELERLKKVEKMHPPPEDPENKLVIEESEEMHPPTDNPDNDETADDKSIHLILESSDSDSVQDEEANISCYVDESVAKEDEEGESLAEEQSEAYPNIQDGEGHGSDQSSEKPEGLLMKLLAAISGLSRQLTLFAADVNQQFTTVNTRLLSIGERMAALESNCCPSVEETTRKRRAHNPKIAEAVRRLHNSEANCRRYEPEQGLSSPHNEAVTSYLVGALAASPDLRSVDNDAILSACKTYYETVRRNFRYSQPDLAAQAAAMKSSARSRQRRKRLLEARQGVLAADEMDFWKGITIDMMSDEEDGTVEGVSGWIVRPPSFRSQELTNLCATLQARLEANRKYTATHHRRLYTGPHSDRMPPNTYDSEAAKRHFKAHLMPQVRL
ncbi:hypothetical protein MATL_G00067630 [Megalops atlanticus]|uniref:Uncharacterized protein n=1 Tax=Megalops atlanticus TaxID=7932 RepID=A0A9D3QAK4_MEGAT|nr:hypothetical protein MATL_G00067630 [Megalops atlanticus]